MFRFGFARFARFARFAWRPFLLINISIVGNSHAFFAFVLVPYPPTWHDAMCDLQLIKRRNRNLIGTLLYRKSKRFQRPFNIGLKSKALGPDASLPGYLRVSSKGVVHGKGVIAGKLLALFCVWRFTSFCHNCIHSPQFPNLSRLSQREASRPVNQSSWSLEFSRSVRKLMMEPSSTAWTTPGSEDTTWI